REWLTTWRTWVVRSGGRLVGAARARPVADAWDIGRIMVAPDLQGRGLGRLLLEHAEQQAPAAATRMVLFTGARSERNMRMYRKSGYRPVDPGPTDDGGDWAERVALVKPRRRLPG